MNTRFTKGLLFAPDAVPPAPVAEPPATEAAPEPKTEPQEKKFTQAELEAHIKERLDRAEKKAAEKREAEKLQAEQELAAKNGEWQKLAEAREKEANQAKADAESARNELQTERIRTAFFAEASKSQFGTDGKQKFIDPDDAYRLAERAAVSVEDGKVVGVADALKTLAKSKPHLLEAANTQNRVVSPVQGVRPTTQQPSTSKPGTRTRY